MAAHDEDDLHRPEALEPKLFPLVEGNSKFRDENSAEPADADGSRNVSCTLEPMERSWRFHGQDELRVFDAQGQTKRNSQQCRHGGDCKDDLAVDSCDEETDDANLQDERDFDAY